MHVNESRFRVRQNEARVAGQTQHPNLMLTLERIKVEEAAIQSEYTSFASLVGVVVAVVGFVVTGAFSALDKLTWGLAQQSANDFCRYYLPNGLLLILGLGCGFWGLFLLHKGYQEVVLVTPWKEYKDTPLKATTESADQVLFNLIQDIKDANNVNGQTLESSRKKFFTATRCLFAATLMLLAVGGYNSVGMADRAYQDAHQDTEQEGKIWQKTTPTEQTRTEAVPTAAATPRHTPVSTPPHDPLTPRGSAPAHGAAKKLR